MEDLTIPSFEAASFVCSFYKLFGAELITQGPVLEVHLPEEAAKRLDGPWARAYSLRLIFREEDLAHYPEAELVTLGSSRLHRLIQQASQKGRFTRIALSDKALAQTPAPCEPGSRFYPLKSESSYRPHLAITFSFAFYGDRRWEESATFCMDRVDGNIYQMDWNRYLPYIRSFSEGDQTRLTPGKFSFYRSYKALEATAIQWVANEDSLWSQKALARMGKEQNKISSYFDKLVLEEAWKEPEAKGRLEQVKALRLKEQEERFAPKVYTRPLQTALLAVPHKTITYLKTAQGREEQIQLNYQPFIRATGKSSSTDELLHQYP